MMIGIYAIKDTKAELVSQPFHFRTDGEALRAFVATVRRDEPNLANTFPEDKRLLRLGYYDDQTGKLSDDMQELAIASSYVVEKSVSAPVSEVKDDV